MAIPPTTQKGTIPIRWIEQRQRYQLTVYTSGTKKRSFYKTKKEAEKAWLAHARLKERHGKQAVEYTLETYQEYTEAKRLANGADLRDVARFYQQHHPAGSVTINIEEAKQAFLNYKKTLNLSPRLIESLTGHLDRFATDFQKRALRGITGNEIINWYSAWTKAGFEPKTIHNYHGSINSFFNWCKRRKMVSESPTNDIHSSDLPTIPNKPKGILTPHQASSMMEWVEKYRPEFAVWFALQLFAGLRHAETGRVRWEWIDLERKIINLPGWFFENEKPQLIVKTQDDWSLRGLPDNLWDWLLKYKKESDQVCAPSPQTIKRIRNKHFRKLPHPIEKWPFNALRHTFCVILISLHEDAAKVANWSRHKNQAQLYDSYVTKLVSKEEAEAYLSIRPTL